MSNLKLPLSTCSKDLPKKESQGKIGFLKVQEHVKLTPW